MDLIFRTLCFSGSRLFSQITHLFGRVLCRIDRLLKNFRDLSWLFVFLDICEFEVLDFNGRYGYLVRARNFIYINLVVIVIGSMLIKEETSL